jgi:predicted nucleic acid-binding protein
MRALLDLNIILDVLLSRDPWRAEAEAIWDANRDGRFDAAVSAASLPTLFYIMRKQIDLSHAHEAVKTCLQLLEVIPVDRTAVSMATTLPGSDFEDNLLIACAVAANLDAIVTRDPRGFAGSPVAVLSPAELLEQLPKDDHA